MNLILQRKTEINNTVLGELSIDGKFFCYTLEDKIRDVKIKHETCIPPGNYKILLTLSQRFKTILPILLNVPGFEGIRIHAGNTIEDTSGCLLVGSAINGDKLLHSKTTLQQLLLKLTVALKKGEVRITVLNPVKTIVETEKIKDVEKIIEPTTPVETILPSLNIPNETKLDLITLLNKFILWLTKFYKN